MTQRQRMNDEALLDIPGSTTIFGFEPRTATLRVRPRSVSWRATRAGALTGGGVLAAPVVALLPPHVAWALGAVVTGGLLGYRKWNERFTLEGVEGRCPKCDAPLQLSGATRLKPRSTLPCGGCNHDLQLLVEGEALSRI